MRRIFFLAFVFLCIGLAAGWAQELTSDQQEEIRRQIESNWNIDPTIDENIIVALRITLDQSGKVTSVSILDDRPGDKVFQSLADSARRAVLLSSPLKLPAGQYWPTLILNFNPKDALP